MVVRGRLAFDDQGRLVEIAADAADPTNPQPSEIEPVAFEELIAQTAAVENLDAGQLVSALDAAGYDISNVGTIDANTVSTGEVNSELYAEPGEIQATIDAAAGRTGVGVGGERATVKLIPSAEYDPTAEVAVKPGVTLDFNGAQVVPSTDHDLFFVDNHARIRHGDIDLDSLGGYTSRVFRLSTAEAAIGKYAQDQPDSTHSTIEAEVRGKADAGTGLELLDDAGVGITIGCRFDLTFTELGTGVRVAGASGGFINGCDFNVHFSGNGTDFLQEPDGSGNEVPFGSDIYGTLQATVSSDYGIRNRTGDTGPHVHAQIWDAVNYGQYALAGPKITVIGGLQAANVGSHTDGASNQIGIIHNAGVNQEFGIYNFGEGNYFDFAANAGTLDIRTNFSDAFRLEPDGMLQVLSDGNLRIGPEDLTTRTPVSSYEVAMHNGAGTAASGMYRGSSDATTWVKVEDNTVTI